MTTILDEQPGEAFAREALLDHAYGPERFEKPSEALRAGREAAIALCARDADGTLTGTVRLWHVADGKGTPFLLLGPLAVDPAARSAGLGAALMRRALNKAALAGYRGIALVGDAAYYGRFGFAHDGMENLVMPGLTAPHRLLGLSLSAPGLEGVSGTIRATGRPSLGGLAAVSTPLSISARLEG